MDSDDFWIIYMAICIVVTVVFFGGMYMIGNDFKQGVTDKEINYYETK